MIVWIVLALTATAITFIGISLFLFGRVVYLTDRNEGLEKDNQDLAQRNQGLTEWVEELEARIGAAARLAEIVTDMGERLQQVEEEESWPEIIGVIG